MIFGVVLSGQSFQNIRGRVTDRASGAPLKYASVSVEGANFPFGASADSTGMFVIHNLPAGRYDLRASFVGYETALVKDILLSSVKEAFVEIQLTENENVLAEVSVTPRINKSQTLNTMALGSARMFSVEETGRYAGGFDDPSRMATAFAGASGSTGNNGIVVRGNSPKFLQWRLEGVEIPNPNHFADVTTFGGGAITAFSSQLTGNSDFFTGAFPAEYGNALSGVFDMNLRNGNSEKRETTFQAGIIGIDFASEGPFVKKGGASYLFNYRYSTLALMSGVLPENADAIRYQDLSFKLYFPTARMGTFSLWGMGLLDASGADAKPDSLQEYASDKHRETQKQNMGAAGLNHKIFFRNSSCLRTSLAVTSGNLLYNTDIFNRQTYTAYKVIENSNTNFILSSSYNRKFSAKHVNKTGITLTGLRYKFLLRNNADNTGDMKGLRTVTDESGFSALMSAYSSSSINFSDRLTLNLGIHTQFFCLNSHYAVEPRAAFRWKFATAHSAGLSYGLHSRLEMLNYYFTKSDEGEFINRNLDFTRAQHLVATYDWHISDNLHLRVEPYIQKLFNIPVIADASFSFINLQRGEWFISEKLENSGTGLNYGVDLTFEKYMSKGYYYMLTASLFGSRYRAGDGIWRNTRYNRNCIVNLLSGKEWLFGESRQNIFNANVRLTFQGGERHSPVDMDASLTAQDVIYNEKDAFSQRYPADFVCHITISYKVNRKKTAHEIALKILNVTKNEEYYGYRYNYRKHSIDLDSDYIIIPNISYKIEF